MYRTASTGSALAACVTLGGLVSSCGLLPIPTTSDVPCLRPTAWPDEATTFLMRLGSEGDPALLLASRTPDQLTVDLEDGVLNNGPHGPVYRLDRATGGFELVADEQWDELDSKVARAARGGGATPLAVFGGRLEFDGRVIPVAGGTALNASPAPGHEVKAVLSTSGAAPIPFISSGGTDGQHYHRLYSEVDGSPIGPALRLGVGGRDKDLVKLGWGPDDRYVVYFQDDRNGRIDLICVVFVGDEIDGIDSEEP